MSELENDYIVTIHPVNAGEVRIRADLYYEVKNVMLQILRKNRLISCNQFFGNVNEYFRERLGERTSWIIYRVKLDLESRGIIRHVYPKNKRRQHPSIKLVRVKSY